jgi:hypothetical protein
MYSIARRHFRTRLRAGLVVAVVSLGACGSTPSSPSPSATPNPLPVTDPIVMFTGRVTATNGHNALPNVKASFPPAFTAVTDSAGMFTMRFQPGTISRLTLEGESIVPRSLVASVSQTRVLDVDAIELGGAFDLKFYRQLVRDDVDSPGVLRSLRRWTQAPNIYLRTIDDSGRPMDAATLDLTEGVIRQTTSLWTGGRFGVGIVERGTDTRQSVAGWITVIWISSPEYGEKYCGRAEVAVSGGAIELYARGNCRCAGGPQIGPAVVRHELGHAMGFFHSDSRQDVMWNQGVYCNESLSARELYHAAIAYARPVGNTDPDADPTSTVYVQPLRIP